MFDSGLRLGEARAVRRPDIRPRAQTLVVRAQKTRRRLATLTLRTIHQLRQNPGRLAPHARARSPRTIQRRLATAALKARLGHLTPHHLRHSFATRLLFAGLSTAVIAHCLGHSGKEIITRIYLHPGKEMLKYVSNLLDAQTETQK